MIKGLVDSHDLITRNYRRPNIHPSSNQANHDSKKNQKRFANTKNISNICFIKSMKL